ncbi:hypothetical protein CspHIS471_0308070 [Cutaneotrichosporon sp. HIS471]|nr:hypothetical protein CspHIS471_0308070 [Cutaneotrichosporon sp. HIS471]
MSVTHLVIRLNSDSGGESTPAERERSSAPHSAALSHSASASPPSNMDGQHLSSAYNGGTTPRGKREEEDEIDELRDDEPVAPTPARSAPPAPAQTAPVVPSPKPATSGSKSRKSSCDLCHHRKIKCDQVRPSCSSCLRKGHPCHYSEETEANNVHNRRAVSVAVAGGDRHIEIPKPVTVSQRYQSAGGSPAWLSSTSRPKSGTATVSRPTSAAGGSADRKRRLDRDRIVNGYGSSSDEEGAAAAAVPTDGPGPAKPRRAAVDNDLADMLGESKDDEVDELDSGDEKEAGSPRSKKRDASVDDDLSNDLLELASAPPKKKKVRPSMPELPRTSSSNCARPAPRASLPAQILPQPLQTASTGHHSSVAARWDASSAPLLTLMGSLPSSETQTILFQTFFQDPFLTEGISLLQPQFVDDFHSLVERRASAKMREGDATTLANAFAFLAVAMRVLPEETGKLLLASGSSTANSAPRSASRIIANQPGSPSDPTPLDQRYFELALLAGQIAEQRDAPSVMYVVHKLILFRYATLGFRKDRVVLAGGWLAQAIKTAQALGMSKEWEGIPQGERELRRRVMWALYVADRQFAFETAFPYTILDTHQGIHLPSPISEADLYKIPPDAPTLPPHSTEAGPTQCTALFIHTHLARRITPILDSFATVGPSGTPHDLVLRFDASLDAFQDALPPYLRLFPLTDTRFDSAHTYLAPHRVRLHSTLLSYRLGVHRAHLAAYFSPSSSPGVRAVIAQVCLASIRVQKSAKMLDSKLSSRLFNPATVFEAAATLALIMHVERWVAGPTAAQAIGMSSEYLAMRAGVADGSELLDSVSASLDGGTFARGAVRVLREVVTKVDNGPRFPSSGSPHNKTNGMTNGDVLSPNGDRSTSPQREGSPNASIGHAGVNAWLDYWRSNAINIDYLLREADWNSWEKVIAGM